jgi:glycosyltransferase involved in cell wall biosynthesis
MTAISAVLPAYNEEALIEATASTMSGVLRGLVEDYEVIVVNDGSKDRTEAIVTELATRDPHVRCVTHPVNRGYGEALRTGFSSAQKELIFFTDGDKQFDVREIAGFIARIDQADLVIGFRRPRRDPFLRLVYAWGWKLLITALFGYVARDIDCAFKLFRRSVWESVRVRSGGATFSAEFLVRARRAGFRVLELPVSHLPREAGKPTGGSIRVIVRAFKELIWLRTHVNDAPDPVRRS